jgi:arginyl-tRNA synthetase
LYDQLTQAVRNTAEGLDLRVEEMPPIELDVPKLKDHGDLATNFALVAAKRWGQNPVSYTHLTLPTKAYV